jgi:hypothetical protein
MYHTRKVSCLIMYMCDRCIECASYLQYLFIGFWTVPCARQQSLTPIELASLWHFSLKCLYHARKVSGPVIYVCDRYNECAFTIISVLNLKDKQWSTKHFKLKIEQHKRNRNRGWTQMLEEGNHFLLYWGNCRVTPVLAINECLFL